jgi:hypothetical protein
MVKLKIGAKGVQRDGKEVGPFEPSANTVFPFAWGGQIWREDGTWCTIEAETSDYDIVRVFGAPAAELSPVDLTQITTPFGMLDAGTQAALKAWPHGWELFSSDGKWVNSTPSWSRCLAYRAKPAPAPKPEPRKPRQVWWSIDWSGQWYMCEFRTRKEAEAFSLKTGHEVILFREVIDDIVESLPSC